MLSGGTSHAFELRIGGRCSRGCRVADHGPRARVLKGAVGQRLAERDGCPADASDLRTDNSGPGPVDCSQCELDQRRRLSCRQGRLLFAPPPGDVYRYGQIVARHARGADDRLRLDRARRCRWRLCRGRASSRRSECGAAPASSQYQRRRQSEGSEDFVHVDPAFMLRLIFREDCVLWAS